MNTTASLRTLSGAVLFLTACSGSSAPAPATTSAKEVKTPAPVVLLASDVVWEQLNPARGDKSPGAATLWGDRNGSVATGFLFRAIDGFASPPHIHNVSYRGVVIGGHIHNRHPDAEYEWMPPGSFWTQPKGAVHITAARGSDVLAYIEIDEGPYLVRPVDQAFESGEQPINQAPSTINWVESSSIGTARAELWGDPTNGAEHGSLIKLPSGYAGVIHSRGTMLRAVVVAGQLSLESASNPAKKSLEPGSLFSSEGNSAHPVACGAETDCVLYVRMQGTFEVRPAQ